MFLNKCVLVLETIILISEFYPARSLAVVVVVKQKKTEKKFKYEVKQLPDEIDPSLSSFKVSPLFTHNLNLGDLHIRPKNNLFVSCDGKKKLGM